ncbi:MAG TPA: helix-turn-helix domain-containing protein [Solirubrobacterales bacterium]|nr:helix-turn-helix domain-containing protein [Solirubrobacterales bacterium]
MNWMVSGSREAGGAAAPSVEELRLVWLLAEGRTDEFVAARLGCTRRTLQRRLRRVLEKLGAASRFQAGALAERAGWLAAAADIDAQSRQGARKEESTFATKQEDREPGRPQGPA